MEQWWRSNGGGDKERETQRERKSQMSNVFGFRDRFLFFIFLTGEIGLECNK